MIQSHKKLDAIRESRTLRATIATIALWATLVAACVAADDQPSPSADSVPKTINVSGVVKDALVGKPIKDATLTIFKLSKPLYDGREVLQQIAATTDADGKYSFTLPTDQAWHETYMENLPNGIIRRRETIQIPLEIFIKHPDYVPSRAETRVDVVKSPPEITQEGFLRETKFDPAVRKLPLYGLRTGKEVTGTLQSDDGKPLIGIKVVGHSQVPKNERVIGNSVGAAAQGSTTLISAECRRIQPAVDEVETDANGRFRVMMITPGEAMLAILPEKNYAPQIKVLFDQRGDLGNIKLDSGPEIQGRVLNPDGGPVKGQQVSITPWELPEAQYSDENIVQYPSRTASTDENGNFSTGPLGPREYRVDVLNPNRQADLPEVVAVERNGGLLFVPQKLKVVADQPVKPLEIHAAPTVSIEGDIIINAAAITGFGAGFVGQSRGLSAQTRPVVQGAIDGITYRVLFPQPGGHYKINLPLGLTDVTIELPPLAGGNLQVQPQWRLGDNGPLQDTTKIRFGKLNKNITDLQIIYGPQVDPGQPQPAAAGRGRAAQPAGRAVRGGAPGAAAPAPVPADTNDDSDSK